ncbi:MAG: aminotransferase class V-fold PLP-dependent enzyme, partial [Acidobacteria bacterium]|nr:aminotransferase class V-fold PLP-dependent enzyme [Acidobacteriota bacterium]
MSVGFPLPSLPCRVECGLAFDPGRIRADFPILQREIHGKPLVYLDNAATTQKPRHVIQALVEFYERYNANVHRGIHRLAEEATGLYEAARERVAVFLGVKPNQVVFTRNATESLNLMAYAWARRRLGRGDVILLTEMEHHSNLVPWQLVAAETGAAVRHVPVTAEGLLDREAFARLIGPEVKIFSLIHASNVLGTINPVEELIADARRAAPGVTTIVDATQTLPQMPVRFRELGCDALAFSGHKMYGPTGIGVLVGSEGLLSEMGPFLGGGEMIERVTLEGTTYALPPHRFEAGTPNFADAVALGATVEYLDSIGMARIREHGVCLVEYALPRLAEVPS